ncbi:hypothetical protein FGO68_gene2435 [Halteria grandinella]|uniref:Uncharacterized protein n=1 Tax=Halteria grandinella TaxID=5974 RepID=A0A8J8SWM4_HALGN|nr:hypothetical protein FGO68_gene2435 [Halteria grandinella]
MAQFEKNVFQNYIDSNSTFYIFGDYILMLLIHEFCLDFYSGEYFPVAKLFSQSILLCGDQRFIGLMQFIFAFINFI